MFWWDLIFTDRYSRFVDII